MSKNSSGEIEAKARALLAPSGIVPLGWFRVEDEKPALLCGNVGASLWPAFSHSEIHDNGLPDPLNRWTQQVVGPIAAIFEADVRYPFGNKVWPFQRYAREATGMKHSPLGLLIHPGYGLWIGLRAALVFNESVSIPSPLNAARPCDSCDDKPCLSTCPVSAFASAGYTVDLCRSHLTSGEGANCIDNGCMARLACPVGQEHAYGKDQQEFHMTAFV